jgi:hypothetical protein
VLATHPKNVYLPEAAAVDAVNGWLGAVFARENRDVTVAGLVASQEDVGASFGTREAAKKRLDGAEARLRRLRAAIEAGVDPEALVEGINAAQSERAAARAELDNTPVRESADMAEVYAMIDSFGDVRQVLHRAEPAELEDLYGAIGLEMVYHHDKRAVDVTIRIVRVSEDDLAHYSPACWSVGECTTAPRSGERRFMASADSVRRYGLRSPV